MLTEKGEVAGSANLGVINWPVDLAPKTETVFLALAADSLGKQIEIVLDPDESVKEKVRLNNRLVVDLR